MEIYQIKKIQNISIIQIENNMNKKYQKYKINQTLKNKETDKKIIILMN